MKNLKSMTKVGLNSALAYKFSFFVTCMTAPISLIVFYFLWKAIFTQTGQEVIRGFTFDGMVSYYVLSVIMSFFIWSQIEIWMEYDIVSGEMVSFFSRPMKLITQYYGFELGMQFLAIVVEAIPIFILGIVFFNVALPTVFNGIMFLLSLILATLIMFMLSFLLGMSAFWLKRISGITKAKMPIIGFFSGAIVPLTFFPEWFQAISKFLPFQYLRYVPISIYLGNYTAWQSIYSIVIQVVWVAILFIIIYALEKRAFKKFAGAGI